MRATRELYRRMRALVRGRAADAELDDEIRFHLEMETASLIGRGHAPGEARRLAQIEFGAADRFREEAREQRGIGWLEATMREARLSLRRLRREPAFASAAIATLALGLGATVAVLALVDGVLLSPLPYPHSERLVRVGHEVAGQAVEGGLSDGLAAYYAQARSLEVLGTVLENEVSITEEPAAAERVQVAMLSPQLLALVAPRAALGRLFDARDLEGPAAVISWELWQRRYGGDSAVIGRIIEVNRGPRPIIGVMPRGFDFPDPETGVWLAWGPDDSSAGLHDLYLTGIGRLRPGVSVAEAEAELAQLLARIPERYPEVSRDDPRLAQLQPAVRLLKDVRIADMRAPLLVLLVLVGVVLVIAWANVVNLVVLRAQRQRREVVIARALGAGNGALVRRLLTEMTLICGAGATFAVVLAATAVALRFGFEPHGLARLHEVALTWRVVAACIALALCTVALLTGATWFNLGRASRGPLRPSFAHVTASRASQRTQNVLVGVQVALALVLLVACGATAQSLMRLQRVEIGFDPAETVIFELNPPARQYLSYGRVSALHARVRDAVAAIPGIEQVEATFSLPLQPRAMFLRETIAVDGAPDIAAAAFINMATPGLFDAVGIPVLAGRAFSHADIAPADPVVIVSAELARRLFGNAGAIGRRVRLQGAGSTPALRIVGVAGDVVGETLSSGPVPVLYRPAIYAHGFDPEFSDVTPYVPREMTIVLKTALPASALAPAVRSALAEIDSKIPLVGMQHAERLVERASARARLITLLLGVASLSAIFLGAVGLWGVVAYTLMQRAPELALRMALGAQPRGVLALVLRQGMLVAALGALAGCTLALVLTRGLAAVLYEVDAADPLLFTAAAALILGIALAACLAPARHATRVDPATLLRAD